MSFAEKGAVGDIDPAFFIGYLYRQKVTGTLKFEDAPIQRAIYVRDGRVLFSSSNAAEDQLGAILVAGGKISQEKFDSIVAGLEPKQSIAAALAQGGHVSQRDIGDAARRKVEQIIASCCAQTTGQYEFEDGVLPKGALDLKLTTEKVMVSAFEVLEPSGFLSRILKSPVAVLARAEAEVTDPELQRLHEALDGESTLADIGGKVGLPLAATEARAAVLVVLGAASVVTSQIEEMSLPDTGETSPDLEAGGVSIPGEAEAETIGFGQVPDNSEKLAFGQAEEAPPSSSGSAPGDSTLVMDDGSGVPAPPTPSQSGALRASGGRRERATTQDLDAVKELIGSPAAAPRPGSASIPSQRWEPVLSAQSRPGRDRGGVSEKLRGQMAKTVGATLLLVLVAGVGWIAYTSQNRTALPAPNPPAVSPSPVQIAEAVPPAAAVTPSPLPPPPIAQPSKPAAPSATPAPTKLAEKPSPTPRVTAPAIVPAPTAAPPVATTARPSSGAYEALKAGRLAEAAAAFEEVAQARSSEFSVQLLVACSPQTIEKAIQNDPSPDLFVLNATLAGKPCHRLMRGFFPTTAEAAQGVSKLPAYYAAEGAKPKAVPLKSVLK